MYEKILAAVNEFTNSEIAANYAIAMARARGAKLFLVFVSNETTARDAVRKAESALERLFLAAEGHGVEVESAVLKGDPFARIAGHVAERGIGAVFTATRREDITKRMFVRTLSRRLVLKLPCSVAVVRVVGMGKPAPKHILVPLKGGRAFDERRAWFVARLAQGFGSRVTLFHLPEPVTRFFHGEVHLGPAQRDERLPADIRELMGFLERLHIHHERRTAWGPVAETITIEAVVRRNDLIVMGASQRSLLGSIVKGNPVEEVLRETPCNLIIFRP